MIYSIGQLSKATQCKIPTIRYYEEIGLLEKAKRSEGNQRQYTELHFQCLSFICHSRALGFSLDEIKQLFKLQNDQCGGALQSHHIILHHLTDVRSKIDKLQQLEDQLLGMVGRCHEAKAQSCLCLNELKKGGMG